MLLQQQMIYLTINISKNEIEVNLYNQNFFFKFIIVYKQIKIPATDNWLSLSIPLIFYYDELYC